MKLHPHDTNNRRKEMRPMPPKASKLAKSVTKEQFLEWIYPNATLEIKNSLYSALMYRANLAMEQIITQGPYSDEVSYSDIDETTLHAKVLELSKPTEPNLRAYYDRGAYVDGPNEENAVARWTLYHAFRNSNNRKSVHASRGGSATPSSTSSTSSTAASLAANQVSGTQTSATRPRQFGSSASTSTSLRAVESQSSRTQYWDPARNA